MRGHWKLLGGFGMAGAVALLLIVRSGDVAGDPATPSVSDDPAPAPDPSLVDPDPSVQYELGPGKILYEDQSSEEQANLDRMADVTATAHGSGSHEALARAAEQATAKARAEIAARHVGLTGTEDQGVIP